MAAFAAFRATPLDLKAEADVHFLQGINQLIGHGWPYTAPGMDYPGWRFYAAGALNERNPWWIVMPDVTKYLQRVSSLLRQGQPVNDIAIYLPTSDAWARFHNKEVNLLETLRACIGKDVVGTILDGGYNFDFFDDTALRAAGEVEDGALRLGPNKYKAVILPDVERVPLDSLRKIADFAGHGGVVIATRRVPDKVPGFLATDAEQRELREIVQRLFAVGGGVGAGVPGRLVLDEKEALAEQLAASVRPDVAMSGEKSDLGFVHRRVADAEIYFVANTGPVRRRVRAAFRDGGGRRGEWWDPCTGEAVSAAGGMGEGGEVDGVDRMDGNGGTALALDLEAYEAKVVVFDHGGAAAGQPDPPVKRHLHGPEALDLSAGWQVAFEDGKTVTMDKLRSWTDDEATRFYSGRATYERSFDLTPGDWQKGACVRLDLGSAKALPVESLPNGMRAWIDAPVGEAAVVFLNGERIGTVWHPPYALDVTRALRAGVNRLQIVVGNTAINLLAGARLPDYKDLNARYGERFKPQDMDRLQPLPSGLIGPVRMVFAGARRQGKE